LLWERWGQPTGSFSSGFEEEFQRARDRRKSSGEPEIWLCFKKVDPERLKDPGAQLTKVLDFRQSQIALGEVLFRDVTDIHDWRTKLQTWLIEYLLALPPGGALSEAPTSTPAIEPLAKGETRIPHAAGHAKQASLEQLRTISALVSELVSTGEMEFSPASEKRFHEFDVARLFLLSSTWMAGRHTGETLGTHEINLLYKHREELNATFPETLQLLRATVEGGADTKPGWFWLKDVEFPGLTPLFVHMATRDQSANVRFSALRLLRLAGVGLPEKIWPSLPLYDNSDKVRAETFQYLASLGNSNAISFLQTIASDKENPAVSGEAEKAALTAKIKADPNQALADLTAQPVLITDETVDSLKSSVGQISNETLLKGLEISSDSLRLAIVQEVNKRNAFPRDIAQQLTTADSMAIRILAFDSLLKMGEQVDSDQIEKSINAAELTLSGQFEMIESLISHIFEKYPCEKLEEQVDWYSTNGPTAYKVLGQRHFSRVSGNLRSDIESGFTRIKSISEERLKEKYGDRVRDLMIDEFEKKRFNEFIRVRFLSAALEALAAHALPTDVDIARKFMLPDKPNITPRALAVISRFGDETDVSRLLQLANKGYPSIGVQAAATALTLSKTPLQVIRELVTTHQQQVVTVAFAWLLGHPSDEATQFCRELLNGEDASNRVRSVYYLFRPGKPTDS